MRKSVYCNGLVGSLMYKHDNLPEEERKLECLGGEGFSEEIKDDHWACNQLRYAKHDWGPPNNSGLRRKRRRAR